MDVIVKVPELDLHGNIEESKVLHFFYLIRAINKTLKVAPYNIIPRWIQINKDYFMSWSDLDHWEKLNVKCDRGSKNLFRPIFQIMLQLPLHFCLKILPCKTLMEHLTSVIILFYGTEMLSI